MKASKPASNGGDRSKELAELVGRKVVLDTSGPLIYLGTLERITSEGFWLAAADIRDRNEGHDTKEEYICEAQKLGIRENRRRIFVFAQVVVSISALDDVIGT